MSNFEEEPYSIIFASLKHPFRRKILRMLSDKPMSFHLTYHLENLGELILKTEDGKYQLSAFGEAAVATMGKVEEAPKTTEMRLLKSLPIKWKLLFAALMIGLIILASLSYVQYQSLSIIAAEYKPIMELAEMTKKGALLESQHTLKYKSNSIWFSNQLYCVIYVPYDNSELEASLTVNSISFPSHIPIIVQKGDALAWNNSASKLYHLNASSSGKYLFQLPSRGWYTISLGEIIALKSEAQNGTVKVVVQPAPTNFDCEVVLKIIHEGKISPFAVKT